MGITSVVTSYWLQLKVVKYWLKDISGIVEAVFLKLGTTSVHHKKKTKWHPYCSCHCNSYGASLFLSKSGCPHLQPLNWHSGLTWNRHSCHIVFTPISRLVGVDGSCFKTKLGIAVFINTAHQHQNCCYGYSTKGVIQILQIFQSLYCFIFLGIRRYPLKLQGVEIWWYWKQKNVSPNIQLL